MIDYTCTIRVERMPEQAFAAINNVRGWWSGDIDGSTDELGATFTYLVPGVHFSRQKVAELVSGERVVWQVIESDLSYIRNRQEWNGTTIRFDIAEQDGQTEVRFTHQGLVPAEECYEACSNAWGSLISGNLRELILTGRAQPNLFAGRS